MNVGYDRGWWREVLRARFGLPPDHSAHDVLVSAARARTTRGRPARLASDA